MWERLRRIFRPLVVEDPTFGKLVYRPGTRAWEGAVEPAFAEYEVGLLVEADESGPVERQRDFYRELTARYSELHNTIEDILLEQLQNWDPSIGRDEIWARFTLESMSVPRLSGDDRKWELCYTLSEDPHYFCVMFDDWNVEGVRVDG